MRKRLVWLLVGSVGIASLAFAAACSTASGGDGLPAVEPRGAGDASTHDSSAPSHVDSGVDPIPHPDPSADGGAAKDCGAAPTLHPPKADGGIYCPFSATSAGGKNVYCPRADQCCETAKGGPPSTCVTKGSACPSPGSTVWECESHEDCPGSQVCCAHSGDAGAVTIQQDVCGPYLSKFSGTSCQASCTAGELVVCEKQSDCATGTCSAVKPKGNAIGVCN